MRSLPQVHGTACRKHAEILIPSAASGASAPLAEKLAQARVNEFRARCLTCGHQAPLCPQDLGSSCLEDATSPVRSLLHAGHPKTCCDRLAQDGQRLVPVPDIPQIIASHMQAQLKLSGGKQASEGTLLVERSGPISFDRTACPPAAFRRLSWAARL